MSVQAALALHDVKPCSWADGLAGGGEQKLFISPPVSGWILVMGSALPNPCDDEDASFRFLQQLSRKLGQSSFSASAAFSTSMPGCARKWAASPAPTPGPAAPCGTRAK